MPTFESGGSAPVLVNTLWVKTIINPSQEAVKRHMAAIEQRLQRLQTAPQARVIVEMPVIILAPLGQLGCKQHHRHKSFVNSIRSSEDGQRTTTASSQKKQ